MYSLKPLHADAIPAALAKAERYRLLNEPEQAESICEDILAAAPGHREATVMLILALSDQFPAHEGAPVTRAQALVQSLVDPYQRDYYAGLIAERRARALVARGGPAASIAAGDWLRNAMVCFERAEERRPSGNDDARLRWNACARLMGSHPSLSAPPDETPRQAIMSE